MDHLPALTADCREIGDWLVAQDARTVLVDGRSGSGKSSISARLQQAWQHRLNDTRVRLVHLDDIYPGWSGLQRGSEHVLEQLLQPRRRGRDGRWRAWDWERDAPGEWHQVPADAPLILEGVGALTARSRSCADLAIWVEAPAELRRRRALRRDADLYAPYWTHWRAQEDAFLAREQPQSAADIIVRNMTPGEFGEG